MDIYSPKYDMKNIDIYQTKDGYPYEMNLNIGKGSVFLQFVSPS